jgi:hypothetical protein
VFLQTIKNNHYTCACLALFDFTPVARDSKKQKNECGLLDAAVYMMLPVEREFMCQLALPWGTRHLISPELAGKDVSFIHSFMQRQGFG